MYEFFYKMKCYTINSNLWKWYLKNWKYRHSIDIADDVDLKECRFNFYGDGNKIIINSGVKIRDLSITIYGKGVSFSIEENTRIKDSSVLLTNRSSLVIGKDSIISGLSVFNFKDDNHIIIGNNAYINATKEKKVHVCAGEGTRIIIGKDCVISNNVEIHTTDYHVIKDLNENRTNNASDIIIEDHVWVGLRSIILKGTYIAKGCIIGAGSIVTGRFKNEKTIITGCPAIEKRKNIIWER